MKKSLLIVALAFSGTAVMAQQAPSDGNLAIGKKALVGKKLDLKASVSESKTASESHSLWVPIGEANKSGKKNLKLDVKGVKQ